MSTRSIIVVHGKGSYNHEIFRLYKHCDGYPTGNLPIIAGAIERAEKLIVEGNKEAHTARNGHSQILATLIVGESCSVHGVGAKIEEQFDAPELMAEHLGNQGDLEWIYIVNTDARTLQIYGGRYSGVGPEVAVARGTVDPLTYADQLLPEYKRMTRAEIGAAVGRIEAAGFTVNK